MRRLKTALLTLSLLSLSSCTFSLDWYRHYRAEKAVARQDYATAIEIFKKATENDPDSPTALEAAREGARVAHLDAKNYPRAVEFYKILVLRSADSEERKSAQKFIAQIYFENLQDYDQAVVEYEKLLKLENTSEEAGRFRLNLAKAHFNMNNIEQALNEIEMLVTKTSSPDVLFDAKILRANSEISAKRLPEAASQWEDILKEFPDRSKKENVALNLAVCYEEMKDFSRAIGVLERMREGYEHPEFLDIRIRRLRARKDNLPGAQGLKR